MTEERAANDPEFAADAARAGLVVPRPRRSDPWDAAVVVFAVVVLAAAVGMLTGWFSPAGSSSGPPVLFGPQDCTATEVELNGSLAAAAGAPLPTSLQRLGTEFSDANAGCVEVGLSVGTDEIAPFAEKQAEFLALDGPTIGAATSGAPNATTTFPMLTEPVSVVYHLSGYAGPLNLSGADVAAIFNGSLTEWNAPSLVAENPGLAGLPPTAISVVYRSDANSITTAFTEYLAAASPQWALAIGAGPTVGFPVGTAANSSADLVADVSEAAGGVGYAELGGGLAAGLASARVENPSGTFVAPTLANATLAASAASNTSTAQAGDWASFTAVDAAGEDSYPITTFSFAVVYSDLGTAYGGAVSLDTAHWLMTFLFWVVVGDWTSTSTGSSAVPFAALPVGLVADVEPTLLKVAYHGESVLVPNDEGGESGNETGEF